MKRRWRRKPPTSTARSGACILFPPPPGRIALASGMMELRRALHFADACAFAGKGGCRAAGGCGAHRRRRGKVAQALPSAFTLDNTVKIVDNIVIYGLLNWVEKTMKWLFAFLVALNIIVFAGMVAGRVAERQKEALCAAVPMASGTQESGAALIGAAPERCRWCGFSARLGAWCG